MALRVLPVNPGPRDHQDLWDHRVLAGPQDQRGLADQPDPWELLVLTAPQDHLELQDQLVLRDLQVR